MDSDSDLNPDTQKDHGMMWSLTLVVPDSNPDSDSRLSDSDSRKLRWIRIRVDSHSRQADSDPGSDLRCPDSHITGPYVDANTPSLVVLRMYCIDTEALVFMFSGGSSYGFTIHPIFTTICMLYLNYQVFNGLDGLKGLP